MGVFQKSCAVAALGVALSVSALSVSAQTNYVLAGASPGGLWSLLGVGVDKALRASNPDTTVTYQTSGGGFANAALVSTNKVNMGIMHDAEAKLAVEGADPYKAPVSNIRAMAVMYNFAAFQPMISKEFADQYGVYSYEDLAAKKPPVRLIINKRGNIAYNQAVEVLEAYGVTLKDIESWGGSVLYAGSGGAVELMKNRQADMTTNNVFVGHSSVREIVNTIPVVMLPIRDDVIQSVRTKMGTLDMVIPKSAYDFLPGDHKTLALTAMLVVNADTPEDEVYNITKALVTNIGEIQGVHKAMRALTPEMMVGQNAIPFHPGAIKAFKEAGLM